VYHFNNRGDTVAMTGSSGNVTDAYAYGPYGEPAGRTGGTENPFTFVGRHGVMDEGGGLYFMRARYYDSATGRFLSKDPIGFGGGDWNLYGYVSGNPLIWEDSNGLGKKALLVGVVGGLGFCAVGALAGPPGALAGLIGGFVTGYVAGLAFEKMDDNRRVYEAALKKLVDDPSDENAEARKKAFINLLVSSQDAAIKANINIFDYMIKQGISSSTISEGFKFLIRSKAIVISPAGIITNGPASILGWKVFFDNNNDISAINKEENIE